MIWFQLVLFLVAATVLLMVVMEGFALLLRQVARLPRPFPLLLGISLYVVVAFAFGLVVFGLEFVLGPQASETLRLVGLTGYLVCLWLVILIFRHRHLDALKKLGYYQPRAPH